MVSKADLDYEPDLPANWERLDHLSHPEEGSKAYRRDDGANNHLVNMYGQGWYIVQVETADDEFYEKRHYRGRDTFTEILEGQFGFNPAKLPAGQRAYFTAKLDLERVVAHYEEHDELPEEDDG